VSADDEVNGISLQDATFDHGSRTANGFLRRLKEERELALEIVAPSPRRSATPRSPAT